MIPREKTVGQLAVESLAFINAFEKLGIDYCCGGDLSLEDACRNAGIDVDRVAEIVDELGYSPARENGFNSMSLAALCDYIVRRHHVFTREAGERISGLLEKVCAAHGNKHSELLTIQKKFGALRLELENHLLKEERMLFPYIAFMEGSLCFGRPLPAAPFGSTSEPIDVMLAEHDTAGAFLRDIRSLSDNFATPADACRSYKMLYAAFEQFELDLHIHIHLENNLLFPKALEMERSGQTADPNRVDDVRSDLPVINPKHHF